MTVALSDGFDLVSVGNLSLEKSRQKKPCDWLPDQSWEDITKLAELLPEQFGSLPDDLARDPDQWKSVSYQSDTALNYNYCCEAVN